MLWSETYKADHQPQMEEIGHYVKSPLWKEFLDFLDKEFKITPKIEYSGCSMNPGWNVKYKKSGRAVCTLYPDDGFFTCLVSIGGRESMEAEAALPAMSEYIQNLYNSTRVFNGGRWLMIDVKEEHILNDLKELIDIRVRASKKGSKDV